MSFDAVNNTENQEPIPLTPVPAGVVSITSDAVDMELVNGLLRLRADANPAALCLWV